MMRREITKITNRHDTKRTYGQPSEQRFTKRWSISILYQTELICLNISCNVTETDTKTGNRESESFCLFDFLLEHGKQLRSFRDGQLS